MSNTMVVQVASAIYLVEEDLLIDVESVSEEARYNNEFLLDVYQRHHSWDGIIAFTGNHAPSFEVIDEMTPMVMNLCYKAVTSLLQGSSFTYSYTSAPATIYIARGSEKTIVFTPDFCDPFTLPYRETLLGLFRCGERYRQLVITLNKLRPVLNLSNHLQYLQPLADEARATLVANGYLDG